MSDKSSRLGQFINSLVNKDGDEFPTSRVTVSMNSFSDNALGYWAKKFGMSKAQLGGLIIENAIKDIEIQSNLWGDENQEIMKDYIRSVNEFGPNKLGD